MYLQTGTSVQCQGAVAIDSREESIGLTHLKRARIRSQALRKAALILDPDSYDLWLDPEMQKVAVISKLLKPYDARLMRCYPVSTRINNVANDDEECSHPVKVVQDQANLFFRTRKIFDSFSRQALSFFHIRSAP